MFNVCEKCVFNGNINTLPLLHRNSDILFVGQSPEDGDNLYNPILDQYLQELTKKKITYSITNAVQCVVYNIPSKKNCISCLPKLIENIEYTTPKLIVALGKVALRSLTGLMSSIIKMNGHILYSYPIPIAVCINPSAIKHNGDNLAVFEKGILPVLHFFDKVETSNSIEVDTISPTDEEVGFDIETTSLRPHISKLKCFAVSNGEKTLWIQVKK